MNFLCDVFDNRADLTGSRHIFGLLSSSHSWKSFCYSSSHQKSLQKEFN